MSIIDWQIATLVSSYTIAPAIMEFTFTPTNWIAHKPGQHYDFRLTAESGYQAQRSYSIANPPEAANQLTFVIEILPGGEVSQYLQTLKPGDQIELRGPLGGHFIWDISMPGPLVVIGGGTGIVPLMAMLRHARLHSDTRPIHVVASFQTQAHILYPTELQATNYHLTITLTRETPPNWTGSLGRIDKNLLQTKLGSLIGKMPMIYVCGPTNFVEAVSSTLVDLGFNSHEIRTERFG